MKLTQAKLDANRANAQLSSGPKTAEGKAASSRNALRHGLSSGELTVLPTENREDLDRLIQDLNAEFQPAGNAEQFFVDQMVHARWKLLRVRRLEAEALDSIVENGEEDANADHAILAALETRGNLIDKLDRYAAGAERSYSRAVRDLMQLRKNAPKTALQNEAKDAEVWLAAELARIQNEPIPDLPNVLNPLAVATPCYAECFMNAGRPTPHHHHHHGHSVPRAAC